MQLVMEAVGARDRHHRHQGQEERAPSKPSKTACKGTPVRMHLLGDYYPAGDEYDLVNAVTGRLIPPQGIPSMSASSSTTSRRW